MAMVPPWFIQNNGKGLLLVLYTTLAMVSHLFYTVQWLWSLTSFIQYNCYGLLLVYTKQWLKMVSHLFCKMIMASHWFEKWLWPVTSCKPYNDLGLSLVLYNKMGSVSHWFYTI